MEYEWKDRKRHLGMPLSITEYGLSDDRLFLHTGLMHTHDDEILLYRVRDISVDITLWQRIFGVGTITVMSSDKTTPTLELKNVKHPRDVKEKIHQNVEEMKTKRRMHVGEVMGSMDTDDNDLDSDEIDDDFE